MYFFYGGLREGLVRGSKYVAFHISGQIMRRGDTFEFDKVTNISIFTIFFVCCKTFTFHKEKHEIQK